MRTQETTTAPPGWDPTAFHLWRSGQRTQALQASFAAMNKAPHQDLRLTLQIAYYLFLQGEYNAAALLLEGQLKVTPDHFETLLNLTICYGRLNRHLEAVALSQRVLALQSDNFVVLDVLTASLYRLKRFDEAMAAGTRALQLKDRSSNAAVAPSWALPAGRPQAFAGKAGKRNVISYSLWGDQPAYLRGGLRNLLLAPDIYPGWTLRFHVDDTVPAEFIGLITQLGGEVVRHGANATLREKLCWRFAVANDPGVGYFLVRDVDSVLNLREAQAVQAWQASGQWFHLMRDWWTHTDLMLAGLWGGVAGVLPDLQTLLLNYRPPTAETPNVDQWFLRDQVWPYVRQSCLCHDRLFKACGAVPFPGPILAPNLHVGQDEYAAHGPRQAQQLRAWIDHYPCLS